MLGISTRDWEAFVWNVGSGFMKRHVWVDSDRFGFFPFHVLVEDLMALWGFYVDVGSCGGFRWILSAVSENMY